MNKLGLAIQAWNDYKEQETSLQHSIVQSIFETCPGLNSFELDRARVFSIVTRDWTPKINLYRVNDIRWEGETVSAIVFPYTETEKYKSWLVETNLSSEDFSRLILGILHLKVPASKEYLREDYIK